MVKLAVVTLCVGDLYREIGAVSAPLMQHYAERVGADFFYDSTCSSKIPAYEKLRVIRDALKNYDRVLYLDADILVRPDAPNIFDAVPEHRLGVFDESKIHNRLPAKQSWCSQTGFPAKGWLDDPTYYNTGVIVASKVHKDLFLPPVEELDNFYEQTLLNSRITQRKTQTHKLHYKFNRTIHVNTLTGEQLRDAWFVHFAGAFAHEDYREPNLGEFKSLAAHFSAHINQPYPYLKKQIYVECGGGLGDQIASEPLIRYLRNVVYPNDTLVVKTTWPDIFKHLEGVGDIKIIGEGVTLPDTGFKQIHLMPKTLPLDFNRMHPLDFFSLMALGHQLPWEHRYIQLPKLDENPFTHLSKHVLVHPGRSWPSKTFPKEWWNDVINYLLVRGYDVAIIGQDGEHTGTVDVDPEHCIDLRNKLSLIELFTLINTAAALISNDSAVIHAAGAACGTNVILVPSCKHPDYIFPAHTQDDYFEAVYNGLLDYDTTPGMPCDVYIDACQPDELMKILPHPSEVVGALMI